MKYYSILLVLLAGCWLPPDSQECQSDLDCKLDRVCDNGECVSATTPVDPSTSGPTGGGSVNDCGETKIDCNCEAVQAYDGQVFQTTECQSGYVMVTTQGCYQECYTATWQAVCYCY